MSPGHRSENAALELAKAEAALRAARALAELDLWDDALSRAYYAAYHAVTAALFALGIEARTHAGTHDLFFRYFVLTEKMPRTASKDLAALQRYREQADYSTTIRFTAASGAEEVERAAGLVAAIRVLLDAEDAY